MQQDFNLCFLLFLKKRAIDYLSLYFCYTCSAIVFFIFFNFVLVLLVFGFFHCTDLADHSAIFRHLGFEGMRQVGEGGVRNVEWIQLKRINHQFRKKTRRCKGKHLAEW